MKVVDIADEIYRELENPEGVSIPLIAFWLTSNIGRLNNLLNLELSIDENQEIAPQLGHDEKAIFKSLYLVTYYGRRVSANLGAAGTNSVVELTEGNRTIRTVNRTEIAKTFQTLKTAEQSILEAMVAAYKINRAHPRQVTEGYDNDIVGMDVRLGGSAATYRNYYDLE